MTHSFTLSRSFSHALGRIASAVPAFDVAMRHGVYHARQGQVTPLRRLWEVTEKAGLFKAHAWRVADTAIRTAVSEYAVFSAEGWKARPLATAASGNKKGYRPTCSPAEAECYAAALAPLADAMQAAEDQATAKREASKALRDADKKAKTEETAVAAAAAAAAGRPFDVQVSSALSALGVLIEEDKDKPVLQRRVAGILSGMPGLLELFASTLAAAAAAAGTADETGEIARTNEALGTFALAKEKAQGLAAVEASRRASAAAEFNEALAALESLKFDAVALAEETFRLKSGAADIAAAAAAARTIELAAAAAAAAPTKTKSKRAVAA